MNSNKAIRKKAFSFINPEIIAWVIVLLIAIMIFSMSAKQSTGLSTGFIGEVKAMLVSVLAPFFGEKVDVSPLGHFGEYFLLGAALLNAIRYRLTGGKAMATAVVIASSYGISDEIHQLFVPTRSCDPMDWLVDTIAALCAVLIFSAFFKKNSKKE